MIKIGNSLLLWIFTLALLPVCLAGNAVAQNSVSVEATVSETTIYNGERISLSVEITGDFNDVSRPDLPQFVGFRLLSNSPSTSRSYSFVNGKTSTSYSYSYYLIAQKEGTFDIPPISITVDGEKYETDPIKVQVVNHNQSARSNENPDIFLELEVSDKTPVTGQQVITDVVLYFKDGIEVTSYQPTSGWKAPGFWKEELENTRRPQATSTILNGIRYRKAELMQLALFPTKNGELEIRPLEMTVTIRSSESRRDPFSSFFGGFGSSQRRIDLQSDPVSLNVQPLPENRPQSYVGAVGTFDISREISSQNIMTGDPVEISTHFEGTGNLSLISRPKQKLPSGLEIYEPQESTNLNRQNQISGTKTFSDLVVARRPGSYSIPSQEVSYYDPDQKKYITHTLPALEFEVRENPDSAVATDIDSPVSLPVNPITGLATWTSSSSQNIFALWWLWAGIALPLAIIGVAYLRKTYIDKLNEDTVFARSRRASEFAKQRLSKAITISEEGEIKDAYNMLQKAITGFISDRLGLPEAGLSNSDYIQALQKENVDPNLVKNVRLLLDKCSSISYAPNPSAEFLKSHVGLAKSTLSKLKKVI